MLSQLTNLIGLIHPTAESDSAAEYPEDGPDFASIFQDMGSEEETGRSKQPIVVSQADEIVAAESAVEGDVSVDETPSDELAVDGHSSANDEPTQAGEAREEADNGLLRLRASDKWTEPVDMSLGLVFTRFHPTRASENTGTVFLEEGSPQEAEPLPKEKFLPSIPEKSPQDLRVSRNAQGPVETDRAPKPISISAKSSAWLDDVPVQEEAEASTGSRITRSVERSTKTSIQSNIEDAVARNPAQSQMLLSKSQVTGRGSKTEISSGKLSSIPARHFAALDTDGKVSNGGPQQTNSDRPLRGEVAKSVKADLSGEPLTDGKKAVNLNANTRFGSTGKSEKSDMRISLNRASSGVLKTYLDHRFSQSPDGADSREVKRNRSNESHVVPRPSGNRPVLERSEPQETIETGVKKGVFASAKDAVHRESSRAVPAQVPAAETGKESVQGSESRSSIDATTGKKLAKNDSGPAKLVVEHVVTESSNTENLLESQAGKSDRGQSAAKQNPDIVKPQGKTHGMEINRTVPLFERNSKHLTMENPWPESGSAPIDHGPTKEESEKRPTLLRRTEDIVLKRQSNELTELRPDETGELRRLATSNRAYDRLEPIPFAKHSQAESSKFSAPKASELPPRFEVARPDVQPEKEPGRPKGSGDIPANVGTRVSVEQLVQSTTSDQSVKAVHRDAREPIQPNSRPGVDVAASVPAPQEDFLARGATDQESERSGRPNLANLMPSDHRPQFQTNRNVKRNASERRQDGTIVPSLAAASEPDAKALSQTAAPTSSVWPATTNDFARKTLENMHERAMIPAFQTKRNGPRRASRVEAEARIAPPPLRVGRYGDAGPTSTARAGADRKPALFDPARTDVVESIRAAQDDADSDIIAHAGPADRSVSSTGQAVTTTPAMTRAETAASVLRQIGETFAQSKDAAIELQLDPEELGRVRFQMVHGEHGLSVNVQADRPETLDLLRRHAEQLSRYLSELGHQSANLSFGEERDQQRTAEPSFGPVEDAPPTDSDPQKPPRCPPLAVTADGLDLRL